MRRRNPNLRQKTRLPSLLSSQLEHQGPQKIQGQNPGRGSVLLKKCLASLEARREEPVKVRRRPTRQRSTAAPRDKRPTPLHPRVPPAPPQLRRVLVLVDPPAVKVKKKEAPTLNALVITGQVLENSAATTARNQGDPAAAPPGAGTEGAAVVGAIMAKIPAATRTPAALSALQQAAALTATAAAATRTATAITARKVEDADTQNGRQTPSMREGEVEDEDDPEGISTPRPPQRTPAHVHAATAAGRGTVGTIGAVLGAPVVGAAAPAQDPGDAVTAEAAAQAAAPPAPPKAPHADEAPGAEQTVTLTAETSTAPTSTALSPHARPHHEALTATHTRRAHRV